MSCYEWEKGEVKIPAKEWSKFRRACAKKWNDDQERLLERAKKIYEADIKPAIKGLHGVDRVPPAIKALSKRLDGHTPEFYELERLLTEDRPKEDGWGTITFLRRPLRKNLEKKAVTQTFCVGRNDWSMNFSNPSRMFEWEVGENNRACDRAHEDPFVQFVFRRLARIEFTRDTGGKIWGNDEYHRDAGEDTPGAGGSYVKQVFGEQAAKRHTDYRRHWR